MEDPHPDRVVTATSTSVPTLEPPELTSEPDESLEVHLQDARAELRKVRNKYISHPELQGVIGEINKLLKFPRFLGQP